MEHSSCLHRQASKLWCQIYPASLACTVWKTASRWILLNLHPPKLFFQVSKHRQTSVLKALPEIELCRGGELDLHCSGRPNVNISPEFWSAAWTHPCQQKYWNPKKILYEEDYGFPYFSAFFLQMAWNTLSDHLPSLVRTLRSLRAALMLSPTSCVRHSENHSPYPYSSFSFLVEVLNFFQASLRNCINCVNCDDHVIFISFSFHFRSSYIIFHMSWTLIFFTGTYEPTIDLLPTTVAP